MNTKLHIATDANGRPMSFFMAAGKISDYIGASALPDDPPKAQWLFADQGYDADWLREALQENDIKPCIRAGNLAMRRSNTTNAATGAATASESCSAV